MVIISTGGNGTDQSIISNGEETKFQHRKISVKMSDYPQLPMRRRATTTDELLEEIGGFNNRYTTCIVFAMGFLWLLTALPIMAPAFISPFEKSKEDQPFYTVQEEFDLKPSWLNPAEWTGSIIFLGNMIVGQIFAAFTDTYGRRKVVSYCLLLSGLACLGSALAPSFPTMLAFRFAVGMFYTPSFVCNWILACECIPFSSHGTASIVFGMFWVVGYCICSPIALFFPNWRHMLIASSIPIIIFAVILIFFLPESLSFLIIKREEKEIERWIERAVGCPSKISYDLQAIMENESKSESQDSLLTMVRKTFRSHILFLLVVSGYLWICDMLVYNGLSYSSTALNVGNNHLNYVLSGLIEIPAYILCPKLLDSIGRRATVSGIHLAAGVSLFAMCFISPATPTLYLLTWLLAKFCCASAFQCLFVYGAEIFPIECRNFALGLCCSLSNIGAMLSPHAPSLDSLYPSLMFIVFGVACVIATFATLLLPETLHTHGKKEKIIEEE